MGRSSPRLPGNPGPTTEIKSTTGVRLVLVGPMPPPVHGQSVVMARMVEKLAPRFPQLRVVDTGGVQGKGWWGSFVGLRRSLGTLRLIRGCDAVYVAAKAGSGMWLTTATILAARAMGARVFVHHHSYLYILQRKPRMVVLARAAGSDTVHIVLSARMAEDLRARMPEIERTLVVGNAGFIDRALLDIPVRADSSTLVLGHLSNLSADKGIVEVVDLALSLSAAGVGVRLIVAGPAAGAEPRAQLDRARRELGASFEYRGALHGAEKHRFFEDITHFVFPSRYPHEAVPLVLYEAMASGAVCIATRQGAIADQLKGAPSILSASAESFVGDVLPTLLTASVSTESSQECRSSFLRALDASEQNLSDLASAFCRKE